MNITYKQAAEIQEHIQSGFYSKLDKKEFTGAFQSRIYEMEQKFKLQLKLKVGVFTGAGSAATGGLYIIRQKK